MISRSHGEWGSSGSCDSRPLLLLGRVARQRRHLTFCGRGGAGGDIQESLCVPGCFPGQRWMVIAQPLGFASRPPTGTSRRANKPSGPILPRVCQANAECAKPSVLGFSYRRNYENILDGNRLVWPGYYLARLLWHDAYLKELLALTQLGVNPKSSAGRRQSHLSIHGLVGQVSPPLW
jgi:hypothetical protein